MKLRLLALTSLASLVLVAGCAAESSSDEASASSAQDLVGATSAYTESSRVSSLDACKQTHALAEDERGERGNRYDCGEMGGYTLVAESFMAPETYAYVRTPSGTFSLDLETGITNLGGGLDVGYFGKLAEWRGRGITSATPAEPYSGRVEPTALIMRYFYSDDYVSTAATFEDKSALFVIKLAPEGACVYQTVSGATANHNQIARDIADSQAFTDFTCPVATPEPLAPTACGELTTNQGLWTGDSIASCSGSHTLTLQDDDKLVLVNNRTGRTTWTARSNGEDLTAIMRPNGQFGLFGTAMEPAFQTPDAGSEGAWLAVQDDGNVVVYAQDGHAIWSTGTQGK